LFSPTSSKDCREPSDGGGGEDDPEEGDDSEEEEDEFDFLSFVFSF
jgi:hypothetical protein